jgi:hypothetical protein
LEKEISAVVVAAAAPALPPALTARVAFLNNSFTGGNKSSNKYVIIKVMSLSF